METDSMEDIALTIGNIFEIIPNPMTFASLTENEQVAIRTALLNMQERAYNRGWNDCVHYVQSV